MKYKLKPHILSLFKLSFLSIFIISSFLFISCNFKNTSSSLSNNLVVTYLDVGQGDSALIRVNNKTMLIDSGPRSSKKQLLKSLDDLKVHTIDYLIATHPHEDHIGNMDDIIDKYKIINFYAPKISTNTKSFEDMITALKRKGLKINILKAGTSSFDLGENTMVTVFSPEPNKTYEDLNDYSPIMQIKFKNTSFLFTGDAEHISNNYVLSENYNIKSNVLKLGHHGSKTSSSKEFFEKVNPSIAIASCGLNNNYGHPHKETLKLLKDLNIKLFRTDSDNNITLISDGSSIFKEN